MSANAAAAAGVLISRRERGWWMGLANMLGKENTAWWRTRRWWTQCLVALFFVNLMAALNLANGGVDNAVNNGFLVIAGAVAPIAVIVTGHDAILGEKHSGTAAWVLSKPLRRPAFILAKLIAHGTGFLATWVVLPGAVAYLEFAILGKLYLPVAGFAGMLGLMYLNLLFYLALALVLGTLFQGRGPVLGIALIVVWGHFITPVGVALADVMPWRLLISLGRNGALPSLGYALLWRDPLPTMAAIIATVLWCVLFTAVAIWRMGREEF